MDTMIACDHPGCNRLDLVFLTGGALNGLRYCSEHHPHKLKWHGEFPKEVYDPEKHIVINRRNGIGLG